MSKVRLGYEVGTGAVVEVPILNTVITGQTQQAGKTTALEGLIVRAGTPALAFVTKRGEKSFAGARRVAPYFRERADWQFVQSVLEATMRERMKFERSWIMRASKGAKTLADVQRNIRTALADKKVRGLNADVYMTLDAYLDIVVPRLRSVTFAPKLDLKPGLNVLDLSDPATFPAELQSLVMRSAIEWVYEKLSGCITIIPEAWEFIPQSRGSPVKLAAIELVRKGSGLGNYVWLDSQDIAGVDKELLRQCPVWLLGVQREVNEIKRVLAAIPAGIKKPTVTDIATLERGQFFACWGKHVVKTYAQPAWMDELDAEIISVGGIALGAEKMRDVVAATKTLLREGEVATPGDDDLDDDPQPERYDDYDEIAAGWRSVDESADAKKKRDQEENDDMTPDQEKKLERLIDLLERQERRGPHEAPRAEPLRAESTEPASEPTAMPTGDAGEEALFERFRERLLQDPKVLAVIASVPHIVIDKKVKRVEIDGDTAVGQVAMLVKEGFFDGAGQGSTPATEEIQKRGSNVARPRVHEACQELVGMGVLWKRVMPKNGSVKFVAVAGVKTSLVEQRV